MPRLAFQPDLSKYEPAAAAAPAPQHQVPTGEGTGFNPLLLCPIPKFSSNPDGLRQYYRGGVPQWRIFSPGQ